MMLPYSKQDQRETRALPELARRRQVAAHPTGEIPADRETKARAFVRRRSLCSHLNERLEHRLDLVSRNPAARVDDLDAHDVEVRQIRNASQTHLAAGAGELRGV